jgi:[acyl-carrier-protein] S-malonyltransferase
MRDVGLLGEVDISARSLEDFRTLQGARAWLARVVN